ncbi:hypothetical protein BGZ97_000239 [Linnemannia gamsii]|uniref:Peptidase A1 domain-containing protein n=1 Tax=Linnemannia gamsii TaxID=64522 RepID=A0A9P6R2T1_9FUNG|nr:hypothetical protein BGZ97_000239 [Linnemannia gamsii]
MEAIMDTGTTLMIVPENLASAIHQKIQGAREVGTSWALPCDLATSTSSTSKVELEIENKRFGIPFEDLVREETDVPGVCYSGIQSSTARFMIIGDVFIKNNYVVFDQEKRRVGIAPLKAEPRREVVEPPKVVEVETQDLRGDNDGEREAEEVFQAAGVASDEGAEEEGGERQGQIDESEQEVEAEQIEEEPEGEEEHGDRRREQSSSEKQRQQLPPPPTTLATAEDDQAALQRLLSLSAKANGPNVPLPSQQSISETRDRTSIRKIFSSLVVALGRHNEASSQTPFSQHNRNEDPSQAAMASEGMLLWREFCTSRAYNDDDRVTPEKLLDYVDLICLPYDNLQQRQGITSNQDGSYPLQVLSLQALVRPVLQLWAHKAHPLDADMDYSEQTFTEGSIAQVEEWERNGQDESADMDDELENWSDMRPGVYPASETDEPEDDNVDWSKETAVIQENALRLMFGKEMKDSVKIPSRVATTVPIKRTSNAVSTWKPPSWTPGRYKAAEFEAILHCAKPHAVKDMTPTPTYNLTLTENVIGLLEEWRFGVDNQMSIQDLNKQYGVRWRRKDQRYYYNARLAIVREFKRLVSEEGMEDDEAVAYLVTKQGIKSSGTLYNEICQERSARNKAAANTPTSRPDPPPSSSSSSSSSSPSSLSRTPSDSERLPSSSDSTSKVLTSSTKLDDPSPKITGVAKHEPLLLSARSTSHNSVAEKEPGTHSNTATSMLTGLSSWRQGFKNKTQFCAPTPGMPEVWDWVVLDRTYRFPIFDDIVTVDNLWEFWTRGWDGGPSVRERSAEHGATWRKAAYDPTIAQWYAPRYKVAQEIRRLVEKDWLESEAVEGIEALRKDLSMEGLAKHLESLDDIPVAISNATRPNALNIMMAQARSTALSRAASGLSPPMGHVGGRCAPRTHVQTSATIQEPLVEEIVAPEEEV